MPSRLWLDRPNERQAEFFLRRERYVAYGGARGGGKSWAVRHKAALLCTRYPGIRVLVVRRSYPELWENHILPLKLWLGGRASYKEGEKAFLFPNGSRLRFGYLDGDGDTLRYQGQEYDVVFIDEATQLTEFQFNALKACVRGTNDFPKRMYLTCNPGGVGHAWVKRLFIDREYRGRERGEDYAFIPARVYDNAALMRSNPGYLEMLESLPDELRRAWLEGDWNVFAGQFFPEFSLERHVVEPFALPGHWRRMVTLDYGLDMLACYWVALDEGDRAYVYRELYRSDLLISDAARLIRQAGAGEEIELFLAPPDLWNRRQESGRSAAEIFFEQGVTLTRTGNRREDGWLALKEWLKAGESGPRMQIFSPCRNLIRTLPLLRHDPNRPGDCAREPHELTHAPDAIRGFCLFRTQGADPPRRREAAPPFACLAGREASLGREKNTVI